MNFHNFTNSGRIARTHSLTFHLPLSGVSNCQMNRSFAELFVNLVNRSI
jgi:hypothetical protein